MQKLLRKLRRAVLRSDPSFCDMYTDARASQAAEEYLEHIRHHLTERFGGRRLTILDAGCQAGRLLIPLAEEGHRLIGIDTSGLALREAKKHADSKNLNVKLHRGNISQLRKWVNPLSVDVVICAEVLYLCRDYQALLKLLADSVVPGGLLCASHRPPQFYIAAALRQNRPDLASAVASRSEGPSPEGNYHNWQTEEDLRALYQTAGLQTLSCFPIDHLEERIDLSRVSEKKVRDLMATFEARNGNFRIPKYLLAIAQKTVSAHA